MTAWLWNEFRALESTTQRYVDFEEATDVTFKVVSQYARRFRLGSTSQEYVRSVLSHYCPASKHGGTQSRYLDHRRFMADLSAKRLGPGVERGGDEALPGFNAHATAPHENPRNDPVEDDGDSTRDAEWIRRLHSALGRQRTTLVEWFQNLNSDNISMIFRDDFCQQVLVLLPEDQVGPHERWDALFGPTRCVSWRQFEHQLRGPDLVGDWQSRAILSLKQALGTAGKVSARNAFRKWVREEDRGDNVVRVVPRKGPGGTLGEAQPYGLRVAALAKHLDTLLPGLTTHQTETVARLADADGDNIVTEDDFVSRFGLANSTRQGMQTSRQICLSDVLYQNRMSASDLMGLLDCNHNGVVSHGEFVRGLAALLPEMDDQAILDLASECCAADGVVDATMLDNLLNNAPTNEEVHRAPNSPIRNSRKTFQLENGISETKRQLAGLLHDAPGARGTSLSRISSVFRKLDVNGDGKLSHIEFAAGISSLFLPDRPVSRETLDQIMAFADFDGDHFVNYDEFVERFCADLVAGEALDMQLHLASAIALASANWRGGIKGLFEAMDYGKDGQLTAKDIRAAVEEFLNLQQSFRYTEDWIERAVIGWGRDKDHTPAPTNLSFSEFSRFLEVVLGCDCSRVGATAHKDASRQSEGYHFLLNTWGRDFAELFHRTAVARLRTREQWCIAKRKQSTRCPTSPCVDASRLNFLHFAGVRPGRLSGADELLLLLSDRSYEHKQSLGDLFRMIDENMDGFVSRDEFLGALFGHNAVVSHVLNLPQGFRFSGTTEAGHAGQEAGHLVSRPVAEAAFDMMVSHHAATHQLTVDQVADTVSLASFVELLSEPQLEVAWEQEVFDEIVQYGRKHRLGCEDMFAEISAVGRSWLSSKTDSRLSRWRTTQQHAFSQFSPNGDPGIRVVTPRKPATEPRNKRCVGDVRDPLGVPNATDYHGETAARTPADGDTKMTLRVFRAGLERACGIALRQRQFDSLAHLLTVVDDDSQVSFRSFAARVEPRTPWGWDVHHCYAIATLLWNSPGNSVDAACAALFQTERRLSVDEFRGRLLDMDGHRALRGRCLSRPQWRFLVKRIKMSCDPICDMDAHVCGLDLSGVYLMLKGLYDGADEAETTVEVEHVRRLMGQYEPVTSTKRQIQDGVYRSKSTLSAVFKAFDSDKDGFLTRQEFGSALLHVCPSLTKQEVDHVWAVRGSARTEKVGKTESRRDVGKMHGRDFVKLFSLPLPRLDWEVVLIEKLRQLFACKLELLLDQQSIVVEPGTHGVVRREALRMLSVMLGGRSGEQTKITPAALQSIVNVFGFGPVPQRHAERLCKSLVVMFKCGRQADHQSPSSPADLTAGMAVEVLVRGLVLSADKLSSLKASEIVALRSMRLAEILVKRFQGDSRKCWHFCFTDKKRADAVDSDQFVFGLRKLFHTELELDGWELPEKLAQQIFHNAGAEYFGHFDAYLLTSNGFSAFCRAGEEV